MSQVSTAEMSGLGHLGDAPTEAALDRYLAQAAHLEASDPNEVALAAALIETALQRHRLGEPDPNPLDVLVADLALSRASRLLAHGADLPLQVAFARAIEELAAAGAERRPIGDVGARLLGVIREGR